MLNRLILIPLACTILLLFPSMSVRAQSISLLRDAELEQLLRDITYPILQSAELTPESVHLYIVADNSLNAFVTGGQNIFIHTGLLLEADHVGQVAGVIAHETCHIACGHALRRRDAASNAGTIAILSTVLGALAIAAGGANAGIGLIGAGQQVATGQYLTYSRGQESEADLAASRYLEDIGFSGRGLVEFFDKLRDQEVLALVRQDPYVRTHPLNRTRILQLEESVTKSPFYNTAPPKSLNDRFLRVKAKLAGYTNAPYLTLRAYPPSNTTIEARYARAYAYHKALEWDKALAETDALIALEPNNPYFYEIKGQIQFENHQIAAAEDTLRHAVALAPRQALLLTSLGQALVAQETPEKMAEALLVLNRATTIEPDNGFAWFNLARAYSFNGDEAMANLATAERYYGVGAGRPAFVHAQRAIGDLETGSPEWIRAKDIIAATEHLLDDDGGRRRR